MSNMLGLAGRKSNWLPTLLALYEISSLAGEPENDQSEVIGQLMVLSTKAKRNNL